MPGQAPAITEQVATFLKHRDVVGGIGIVALLFFSAMAFSILEDAMAIIFHHRAPKRRHPALSAVIPYLFMMALGAGLLIVTLITGGLESVGRNHVLVLGHAWSLARLSRTLLHALGMAGSALMLTALYIVLPTRRVTFRRAFIGGVAATALWEVVRHVLVWYFETLSLVNVVYGSLATTIIVLLTLEAAALILLLGAQVIAELERRADRRSSTAGKARLTGSGTGRAAFLSKYSVQTRPSVQTARVDVSVRVNHQAVLRIAPGTRPVPPRSLVSLSSALIPKNRREADDADSDQGPMQGADGYDLVKRIHVSERSKGFDVVVHDRVRDHVADAADDRRGNGDPPGDLGRLDPTPQVRPMGQPSLDRVDHGPTGKHRDQTHEHRAEERVEEAVNRPVAANDVVGGLEVDRDLRAAEEHKREPARCRALERKADTTVKGRDRQRRSPLRTLAPRGGAARRRAGGG